MMLRTLLFAFALATPELAFAAEANQFCVDNASEAAHLFVAETREGERRIATLQPGERLCSGRTEAPDGVINVFEHAEALEGCGRILEQGQTERFIAYAEFDRCAWGAHSR